MNSRSGGRQIRSPAPADARIEEAISLPADRRIALAESFFRRHPGSTRGVLGLGRALVEFLEWEILSGRLDPMTGSRWWRVVNGLMVLDLHDADPDVAGPPPTVGRSTLGAVGSAAWTTYRSCHTEDAQEAFWHAHQQSLLHAVYAAADLLLEEPRAEQAFVGIVLEVVGQAADVELASDTGLLGASARDLYPNTYPATDEAVALLRARLAERAGTRPSRMATPESGGRTR